MKSKNQRFKISKNGLQYSAYRMVMGKQNHLSTKTFHKRVQNDSHYRTHPRSRAIARKPSVTDRRRDGQPDGHCCNIDMLLSSSQLKTTTGWNLSPCRMYITTQLITSIGRNNSVGRHESPIVWHMTTIHINVWPKYRQPHSVRSPSVCGVVIFHTSTR